MQMARHVPQSSWSAAVSFFMYVCKRPFLSLWDSPLKSTPNITTASGIQVGISPCINPWFGLSMQCLMIRIRAQRLQSQRRTPDRATKGPMRATLAKWIRFVKKCFQSLKNWGNNFQISLKFWARPKRRRRTPKENSGSWKSKRKKLIWKKRRLFRLRKNRWGVYHCFFKI